MILVVNAGRTRTFNYELFFDILASWGFIVAGNDNPQTGTGETVSQTLGFILSLASESVLSERIDKENICIIGCSQDGAGAFSAAAKYKNGGMYKAIFTGSAAYPFLANNMDWTCDVSKITIGKENHYE